MMISSLCAPVSLILLGPAYLPFFSTILFLCEAGWKLGSKARGSTMPYQTEVFRKREKNLLAKSARKLDFRKTGWSIKNITSI